MISRVKYYTDYRKKISLLTDVSEISDYEPKHLLTKEEIKDNNIEKQVQVLNQYEQKRNSFQKFYFRRKIIYYSIVTVLSLAILAVVIYFGIRVF